MRRLYLLVLMALWPLVVGTPCTIETDPIVPEGDGGTADGGYSKRRVDFSTLEQGEFIGGVLDGVTVSVEAYAGSRVVQAVNLYGDANDLYLGCGLIRLTPPEGHGSFGVSFNDDQGTLLVTVFDGQGVSFTDRPIDTRADAQAVGIVAKDASHKWLTARAASVSRLVGGLTIASCGGSVREVVFE